MLTAKIIGRLGFDAVYMTGYGQAASHLGQPDVGLMTMSEMVMRAANMVEACGVPVIADADTGFGNAVNVIRTVREYEKAGVAVIQLEDQVMPKKCGHMLGRQVISKEEMVGKIKAAADTRVNPDFMIMARTDARTVCGIEEALERAHAYREAGADIIFVESPENEEEMRRINRELPGVLTLANMVEGGRTPQFKNAELAEFGFNLLHMKIVEQQKDSRKNQVITHKSVTLFPANLNNPSVLVLHESLYSGIIKQCSGSFLLPFVIHICLPSYNAAWCKNRCVLSRNVHPSFRSLFLTAIS